MNNKAFQTQLQTKVNLLPATKALQRQCACGNHMAGGGTCAECSEKEGGLQRKASEGNASGDLSTSSGIPLRRKLTIGASDDSLEKEADRVADEVTATPANPSAATAPHQIQRFAGQPSGNEGTAPASVERVLASPGRPIEPGLRHDMESRFGYDFSQVHVHSGADAERSAIDVNAKAYTIGSNIIFGPDSFAPQTKKGRWLIAHELTHVIQQTASGSLGQKQQNQLTTEPSPLIANRRPALVAGIQRAVEVRPPGPGEASAFDKRDELIHRMNRLSKAVFYELSGKRIKYTVLNPAAMQNFDQQMTALIDRVEVLPMRLITKSGYVAGGPLLIDSAQEAYVDVDDMLASDDLSFKLNLIHFLVERSNIKNYAHLVGTPIPYPTFKNAHQAAIKAETELLRNEVSDPSIDFKYEETRPNDTLVFGFRSKLNKYWIFHVFRGGGKELRGGNLFVKKDDGTRLTIAQLIAERAAAAAPAVP